VAAERPRVVAAFDFDGTLSRHDSLVPFLRRLCGDLDVLRTGLRNAHLIGGVAAGLVSRDRVKEAVLLPLLGGLPLAAAEAEAERYAVHLVDHELRPVVRERLEWHRERGDEVVIVSASPELYLGHVGRALGCAAVLATRLESAGDRLTGRLLGRNVRGPEKTARLDAWLGGDTPELWAYGDSAGDRELLARADHAFRRRGDGLRPAPAGGGQAGRR
jgi:phosphatidylglycerophosphatase C